MRSLFSRRTFPIKIFQQRLLCVKGSFDDGNGGAVWMLLTWEHFLVHFLLLILSFYPGLKCGPSSAGLGFEVPLFRAVESALPGHALLIRAQ